MLYLVRWDEFMVIYLHRGCWEGEGDGVEYRVEGGWQNGVNIQRQEGLRQEITILRQDGVGKVCSRHQINNNTEGGTEERNKRWVVQKRFISARNKKEAEKEMNRSILRR